MESRKRKTPLNSSDHLEKNFIAQGPEDLGFIKSKSGVGYAARINDIFIDKIISMTLYNDKNEVFLHWDKANESEA